MYSKWHYVFWNKIKIVQQFKKKMYILIKFSSVNKKKSFDFINLLTDSIEVSN